MYTMNILETDEDLIDKVVWNIVVVYRTACIVNDK